jgi:hypothetical protein
MRHLIIFFVVALISCTQAPRNVDTKYILDRDKFTEVLKDKSLAEAALNVNAKNVSGEKYDSVYNFNVFAENEITKAQFDSTMKFYSAHPAELKELMDTVLQKLNIEKAKR